MRRDTEVNYTVDKVILFGHGGNIKPTFFTFSGRVLP